jgi:hypothetical protein
MRSGFSRAKERQRRSLGKGKVQLLWGVQEGSGSKHPKRSAALTAVFLQQEGRSYYIIRKKAKSRIELKRGRPVVWGAA